MIEQEVITVTTTGSAASATGTAKSAVINGFLLDIYLDFHASAPVTTDTTIAFDEPDLGNILVVTNSVTDALYAPRKQASDATGTAITGLYDLYPINGNISVTLAGSDALTGAVVARIRYLRQ